MKFNEKLRSLRYSLNLTLADVADAVGVSKPTVQRWESGNIKNLRMNKIKKLADILMCTPSYLMGWEEETEYKGEYKIPVFCKISDEFSIKSMQDVIDYEVIPIEMARSGDYFGMIVQEDNMEPRICRNDVVIIKRQANVEDNRICAVKVGIGDAVLRKFKRENSGIWLISSNIAFEPIFYTQDEIIQKPVTILGIATEIRGKLY